MGHDTYVNKRRRKLNINEIYTEEDIINDGENIGAEAVIYFACQFKEESVGEDYEMIKCIPQTITEAGNLELTEIPSREKIKKVVFALKRDSFGVLMVLLVCSINIVGSLLGRT